VSKPLYKLGDERPGWSPSADGPAAPAADIGSTVLITTTIAYTYDPLGRLAAARYSDGRYFQYTYDSTGNRLSETKPTGTLTYTYDAANRLLTAGAQTYVWDAAGNPSTSSGQALLSDGAITYTYDSANRLTGQQSPGNVTSYVYNGLGDRAQQTVNGVTTNYALDLNAGLTQVLADTGNVYLYGNGRIGERQAGGWQYHHADGLGSLRALTNASATVTLNRRYKPYGSVLETTGSASSIYGYTGEQQSGGLVYLRARYYASGLGRFVSRDTWQGEYSRGLSLNRWGYLEGNPINGTDPSGHFPTYGDVKSGDAEYTCNCGWIDWKHVEKSADVTQQILGNLRYARNLGPDSSGNAGLWGIRVRISALGDTPLFNDMAVVRHAYLMTKAVDKIAASIFMSANERFEVNQGLAGMYWSAYSEEDLPSDIIGFDIGNRQSRRNFPGRFDLLKDEVRRICGSINSRNSTGNSEDVWLVAYGGNQLSDLEKQGSLFVLPPGAQTGWQNWEARLAGPIHDEGRACMAGVCPNSRQWPSRYAYYALIRNQPDPGKTWWWESLWGDYSHLVDPTERENLYRIQDRPDPVPNPRPK
jgi:RHS repeat-associated protein